MMKKGLFYLLPLLALTQLGASNAWLKVDKSSLLAVKAPTNGVVIGSRGKDTPLIIKTVTRPLSGRNRMANKGVVIGVKPRAGRNVRHSAHGKQLLIRR